MELLQYEFLDSHKAKVQDWNFEEAARFKRSLSMPRIGRR